METVIECKNLVKIYKVSGFEVVALQGLDLQVQDGELMAIIGASGSGKSTLLNILGGLDRPSAGQVIVAGQNLLKASDRALDDYRRTQVGFVWQQTARNLLPYLSAQANIELPMTIEGVGFREKKEWAQELLHTVGLWEHRKHRLAQLSGGQQQRVAIGVALANRPKFLLGDEPTGEIDSTTAQEILALFRLMNEELGLTTVLVTHDPQVARVVDRVVTIRDGSTSSESVRRVSDVEAALTQGMGASDFEEYVVVDKVGRLQIPPILRREMGIGRRVTLEKADSGILIRAVDGPEQFDLPDNGSGGQAEDEPAPRRTGFGRWFKRRERQ